MSAFLQELELNGTLQDNPFKKLHIHIHAPKQLPRIIPEHTVRYILQDAYDTYTPGRRETLRDILVLELLFSTGLRVSELCELTRHTFQLGVHIAVFPGQQGHNSRSVRAIIGGQ